MDVHKIEITHEGANHLREFADVMPIAIENIVQSTEKLIQVYLSVAEEVGPHYQDFRDMLLHVKSAQEEATDAIQVLPPMMYKTADKIDHYVNMKNSVMGN